MSEPAVDPSIALPTPTYVPLDGSATIPANVVAPAYVPAVTPYGVNPYAVNPYMMAAYNPNVNIYEQQMEFRNKMYAKRQEYYKKVLKESFPTCYVIFHILLLIAYIIVAITFQTLMMISKYGLWYIGSGYWCAAYFGILVIVTSFLVKKKTYGLYMAVLILNMFGIPINVGGLVVISAISLPSSTCYTNYYSSYWSVYSYNNNGCATKSDMYQGVVLLVLGILATIELMIYMIAVGCALSCKASNFQVANGATTSTNQSRPPATTSAQQLPTPAVQ